MKQSTVIACSLMILFTPWLRTDACAQTNTTIIIPVPVTGILSPLLDPHAYIDITLKSGIKPLAWKSRPGMENVLWNDKLKLRLEDIATETQFGRYLASSIDELEAYAVEFPNDANALTVLGFRHYQTNSIGDSIQAFARARAADPDHVRSAELYSAMLVFGGDYDFAIEQNLAMVYQMPSNTTIRFNAACSLSLQTNLAEACYHLSILTNMNWTDIRYYLHDRDLDNLRNYPPFQQMETDLAQQGRDRIVAKLKEGRM